MATESGGESGRKHNAVIDKWEVLYQQSTYVESDYFMDYKMLHVYLSSISTLSALLQTQIVPITPTASNIPNLHTAGH